MVRRSSKAGAACRSGLLAALIAAGTAADRALGEKFFYVATWGSPSSTWATNTALAPFATLEQARDQLRIYRAIDDHPVEPITVRVIGGEYTLTSPLVLSAIDSGGVADPIKWIAWENPAIPTDHADVLISGGVRLTSWQDDGPVGANSRRWVCNVAAVSLPGEVRDVYFNAQRLLRARYPDAAAPDPGCGPTGWTNPITPPCPNRGFLEVWQTETITSGTKRQRVTIQRPAIHPVFPTVPNDWAGVEIVAHHTYVAPRQKVDFAHISSATEMYAEFHITDWPVTTPIQELGGFGVFQSHTGLDLCNDTYPWGHLRVIGPGNRLNCDPLPPDPARPWTQVYFENAFAFLTADYEWHHINTASEKKIWIILPNGLSPTCGRGVVVPRVEQLLVLDEVSRVEFNGIDWGYAHFPLPMLRDGVTPGYTSVQSGQAWLNDPAPFTERHDLLGGAVQLRASSLCTFRNCRIAHTGGSGVSVTEKRVGNPVQYYGCSGNLIQHCEIYDTGGHGVYLGDMLGQLANAWNTTPSPATADPHEDNMIVESKIDRFGVIYKDAVGINVIHTRRTTIADNEISFGNWAGISAGALHRHKWTGSLPPCYQPLSPAWPQTTEQTWIYRNDIHDVCLRLIDGAGIDVNGSHFVDWTLPSVMDQNYIHDIVMNPYMNWHNRIRGIRWDAGSDGWYVARNFITRSQYLFQFSTGMPNPSDPQPASLGNPPSSNALWARSTWPIAWSHYQCGNPGNPLVHWPGQMWGSYLASPCGDDDTANRFQSIGAPPSGPYDVFVQCFGHPGLPNPLHPDPAYQFNSYRLLTGSSTDCVATETMNVAGPNDAVFFPTHVSRCGELIWPDCTCTADTDAGDGSRWDW